MLVDKEGYLYTVIGTYSGNFHGIEAEDLESASGENDALIMAFADGENLEVYEGSLRLLRKGRHALSSEVKGQRKQYKFHTEKRGGRMSVKEVPGLMLTHIGRIGPSDYLRADRPAKMPLSPQERITRRFEQRSGEGQNEIIEMLQRKLRARQG